MRKSKKELVSYSEAFNYALDKLSYRDYSQEELEGKLQECSFPLAIIGEVIAKLKDCAYLDEERYARGIYRIWLGKKYYGRLHLRQYLQKKYVTKQLQKELVESFSKQEEILRGQAFMQQQWPKLVRKYPEDMLKRKAAAARSLASRGFGGDLIWSLVEESMCQQDED